MIAEYLDKIPWQPLFFYAGITVTGFFLVVLLLYLIYSIRDMTRTRRDKKSHPG